MDRDRRLSLTVGGFALLALATLAAAILSLSARQGLFQPRYLLVSWFDNVQGLVSGATVRLAGTQVGQVERVELATRDDGRPGVRVLLQIDEDVRQRIRSDSVARIATLGLLGDQLVEISIGTSGAPVLEDGAELATLDPFDLNAMVSRGGAALEAIQGLATNLNATLGDFREAEGGRRLADSVAALGDIVSEVHAGRGMLHSLIYEPYQGSALSSLESSLASLSRILGEVEQGDGMLHSLVYDETSTGEVVTPVVEASARLNSILGKIDRGEGTLGLLLNDPTLYEEIKRLVGGANRSTLVRSMIQMVAPDSE